jgi:anti-sigma regulatory factor (Ser/Thr protein kinase)
VSEDEGQREEHVNQSGSTAAAERPMTGATLSARVQLETPDLEITLPARAENVAVVRHAVGGLGEVLEVDDQTLSDIKLAVTEACTNVVVHAYPEAEGPMGLRASIDERRLYLVVTDRGRGIVPRPDSPGLGLGLPLIATLAESLELGTGDFEETQVLMTFDLGTPAVTVGNLA